MKKILIILMLMLLTGCTIDYDARITKDKKVFEVIKIEMDKDVVDIYYQDPNDYFDFISSKYEREYGVSGYTPKQMIKKNNKYVYIYEKTSTLNEYLNSNLRKTIFNNYEYQEKNGKITVKVNDYIDLFNMDVQDPNFHINPFKIILKSDYYFSDSNADNINDLTGAYTWEFDETTTDKTIEFVLTDNQNYIATVYNNYSILFYAIVIILGSLAAFGIYKLYLKAYK